MRSLRLILFAAALATVPFLAIAEDETPAPDPLHPESVLVTEAVPLALPAFHDDEMAGVELSGLFDSTPAAPSRRDPAEGRGFDTGAGELEWTAVEAADGMLSFPRTEGAAIRYAAFFVTSDRWQKATLSVTSDFTVLAAVDGADLKLAKEDGDEDAPAVHTGEMTLGVGRHLVVLRTLDDPEVEGEWSVGASVTPAAEGSLALTTDPAKHLDIQTVLNAPRISSVSISPDGRYTAVSLGEYRDGKNRETWLELRRVKDGGLERLWRTGSAPSSPQWHPGGGLSWQTTQEGAATIWLYDLAKGDATPVLEGLKDLGRWAWAPDGGSIVYSVTRNPDPDSRRVKRVLHPADRQPWWRGRSHLMQAYVPGGFARRLTAGPLSPSGWELSPDGSRMLFFTSEPDLSDRPFATSQLWVMDMETLEAEMVLDDPWVGGADWSPDGKTLLLQGSPSAFDGLGRNLPEGVQANDYGGQLYLFDVATREPTAISVDLVPDVGRTHWSKADGMIYARATDTQYSTVWRAKPGGDWERVDTGMEYTNQIAVADDAKFAVARGTSSTTPNKVFALDLKKNRASEILDPTAERYEDVVMGDVSTWVADLPDGQKLDGFVYYPPGFDPAQKYPLIVYYYGGTAPVDRSFGGRYPKNVWAGQGYVVYVPNPSGATGYGQEFAARHVNDWGILTAGEVIEATKAFLAAHDFADADHVGCIGASYGGFLTQYIITQTDIFAAAVSHAGISDISSYWGEGFWGYVYGARALANSFPWKDRELFIEQSPLFHADKITTPLLLLHGDADTNVPKGESDQMFTALKVLGKEVEYVQVVGQDHHILDHDQRIVWNDTILAYFARYLKERPDWWDELYPEPTDYR